VLGILYHEMHWLGSILKNERTKTKMAQAYRILFSTMSTYYKKLELCSTAGFACGVMF